MSDWRQSADRPRSAAAPRAASRNSSEMSTPVSAQPRAASGSVSRPAPHGTSSTRIPAESPRCFQRNATSCAVASSGMTACQNSTARPEKKLSNQFDGAFRNRRPSCARRCRGPRSPCSARGSSMSWKPDLAVERVRVARQEHPAPQVLQLGMRPDHLHQPEGEAPAAVRLEDEHVGEVRERRAVRDDPREARPAGVSSRRGRRTASSRSSGPRSSGDLRGPVGGLEKAVDETPGRAGPGRSRSRNPRASIPWQTPVFILCSAQGSPMHGTVSLPLWLAVLLGRAGGVGGARPAAAPERALGPAAARQPRARRAQHAAEDPDPALQADQARGPDRPAALRPAGPAGRRGARPREATCRARSPWSRSAATRARSSRPSTPTSTSASATGSRATSRARSTACASATRTRRGSPRSRRSATVVFLINHRSNMDYILVVVPRRGEGRALLRRRRVGAHLAAPDARSARWAPTSSAATRSDPLYRKVLERYVAHGDGGGRDAGGLSRGRPLARRQAAASEARDPRLHAALLRSGRRARHRLRAGRDQLRPDLRGPQLPAELDRGRARRRPAGDRRRRPARFVGRNLWLMARNRWHRFGYACVNFGSPVSLTELRRAAAASISARSRGRSTRAGSRSSRAS